MVVVLGHVLMAVVVWQHDTPRIDNLLAEIPQLKIATWVLQVMPVFFAAGAVSNRYSIASATARGEPWRVWVWHRERRLIRPVVVYLAVWVPLVLGLATILPNAAAPLGKLSTQLLWFLGVYILVIMTTPWQVRLARHGYAAALGLLVPIATVDLGRFHLAAGIAVANFVLVWFMAATLGLVVRDHVGDRRRRLAVLALAAVVSNVALVAIFPYPISMVGMPGEPISNMAPPTLALALHSVALVAIVGLAWPALSRLCANPRVWQAVVLAGAVAMTTYLWHLTALVGVTVLEHELHLDRGPVGPFAFWLATALHILVFLIATAALVLLMAPAEHRPLPWLEPPPPKRGTAPGWSVIAGVGAIAAGCGLLSLSATGMGGFPFSRVTSYAQIPLTPGLGLVVFALGILITRAGGRRQPIPLADQAAPTSA
jgi:hypothetical protein